MPPIHVRKPSDHGALTHKMHGKRGSGLLQPVQTDFMVHHQNNKNARYVLGNLYVFLVFLSVDIIAG